VFKRALKPPRGGGHGGAAGRRGWTTPPQATWCKSSDQAPVTGSVLPPIRAAGSRLSKPTV